MDMGGIGERQSFQFAINTNDLRAKNTVPDHAAEQSKTSEPITESQKNDFKNRLIENGEPSSVKVEFERNQVPNTETFEAIRGEDGFGLQDNTSIGTQIDLLA